MAPATTAWPSAPIDTALAKLDVPAGDVCRQIFAPVVPLISTATMAQVVARLIALGKGHDRIPVGADGDSGCLRQGQRGAVYVDICPDGCAGVAVT